MLSKGYPYFLTRIKMRRYRTTLALVALLANGSVFAQQRAHSGEIRDADARLLVSIRLEIHAKDAALVIPVCGGDDEIQDLCAGAAFLQVSSHGVWRSATVRRGLLATLGALPKGTWKTHRIEIGDTAYFNFTFSPELMDVQPRQQLRVVADSWPSESAFREKDSDNHLTSPVFDCPSGLIPHSPPKKKLPKNGATS